MPIASCSLDLIADPIVSRVFLETIYPAVRLLHFASLSSLGFRQSHSALTLPFDDAYAIAAADANQAIFIAGSKLSDFKCFAAASELSGQASFADSFAVNLYLLLPFVADDARAALDNCHA